MRTARNWPRKKLWCSTIYRQIICMLIIGQDLIPAHLSNLWKRRHNLSTRMIGISWYIWCNTSEARTRFHWLSVPTEVEFWNGGCMHRFKSILICEYIQEEAYLWDADSQLLAPQNRISTQNVLRRQKLWSLTISCQLSAETDIILRQKATMLRIIICTRTRRVSLFWIRMRRPRLEKLPTTLLFGTSL